MIYKNDGQSQRTAYKAIREISGSLDKRKEIPVKDQNKNLLTKNSDI